MKLNDQNRILDENLTTQAELGPLTTSIKKSNRSTNRNASSWLRVKKHVYVAALFALFCLYVIWAGNLDKSDILERHKNLVSSSLSLLRDKFIQLEPIIYLKPKFDQNTMTSSKGSNDKFQDNTSSFSNSSEFEQTFVLELDMDDNDDKETAGDSASRCQNGTESTTVEREMPEVVQWFKVPENAEPEDEWTLSISGAFYDYRINKIVLILSSNVAGLAKHGFNFTFNCVYFYDNGTMTAYAEGHFFTGYIFYCPLVHMRKQHNGAQFRIIPEAISLLRNDSKHDSVNWTIPVINLLDRKLKRDAELASNGVRPAKNFALCVGILFGFQSWLTILQYIEFHRTQGVQKFFFFYGEIHSSILEIFRWYSVKEPGLIETVYWDPSHRACGGAYKCQLTRTNYCSYILMHKYKFVGDNDFDELFYPSKANQTLIELLNWIDRSSRGSFTFAARYHQYPKYDTPAWDHVSGANISETVRKFIPVVCFRNVSDIAPSDYSPKTITKPETVIRRWIHYVRDHVKGCGAYNPTEGEGFLRHFKFRDWWGGWADQADTVVKFKLIDPRIEIGRNMLRRLISNVERVAQQVKSLSENGWKVERKC